MENDPARVFEELREIVEEAVGLYHQDGEPLPQPLSGRQMVAAIETAAKPRIRPKDQPRDLLWKAPPPG